jgi:hypothetical protein
LQDNSNDNTQKSFDDDIEDQINALPYALNKKQDI